MRHPPTLRATCVASPLLLLAVLAGCANVPPAATGPSPTPSPSPSPSAVLQFDFHNSFLMNLHAALVDAARRPERLDAWPGSKPTAADLQVLRAAVTVYAREVGDHDLLFDAGLRDVKQALATAADDRQDPRGLGLPPALEAALASAAPAYARTAWPAHDAVNRAWIARVAALEARHGAGIQPRLERIFGRPFPARIRDDVVVETGEFSGAYTDEPPPQTVISSGRASYDGPAALEMIWHEAAHAGVDEGLVDAIEAEAQAAHRTAPDGLWHAAHFWAVGAVVRDALARDGVDYVPFATKRGLYARAWAACEPLLRTDWDAWVRGEGTRDGAVRAMVARLPAG